MKITKNMNQARVAHTKKSLELTNGKLIPIFRLGNLEVDAIGGDRFFFFLTYTFAWLVAYCDCCLCSAQRFSLHFLFTMVCGVSIITFASCLQLIFFFISRLCQCIPLYSIHQTGQGFANSRHYKPI